MSINPRVTRGWHFDSDVDGPRVTHLGMEITENDERGSMRDNEPGAKVLDE